MTRTPKIKDYYLVSQIIKIFSINLSVSGIQKKETAGEIPKAERRKRGSAYYRIWKKESLPFIGEKLGYLKKPPRCKVISVFSLKGGTGKTTTSYQLARSLAMHNIKTLIIGLDTQLSITQTLKKSQSAEPIVSEEIDEEVGLFHILTENLDPKSAIQMTDLPSLHFIPETLELSILDINLKSQIRKEYLVKEKIIDPLCNTYDVIICDCNPSWTDIVTATLAATDILVSPLGCDLYSLKAANIFVKMLDGFQEAMKHKFSRFFIAPTLLENNKLSHQVLSKYRITFSEICTMASIRRAVVVQEANHESLSLMEYAYKSGVYQDYANLFQEINAAMLD